MLASLRRPPAVGWGNSTFTFLQVALWALLSFPSAGAPPVHAFPEPTSSPAAQKSSTKNPHGPLSIPCENCHTAAAWRPIRAVPEFDHNKTKYPLTGMHEKVQCTQCHVKPVFTDVAKNCADCHADVHRRQNGSDCQQCHTVQGWNITNQQVKEHQNRFPLLGSHTALQCEQCHKQAATGIFLGLSTQCDSCHLKDWQNTSNPNHPSAGPAFASANCQGCHAFDTFLKANFDHSSTGFPLTNGHANVPCTSCHINNNYNLTIQPNDCGNSGCHLTTWQQTNNPTHPSAGPSFAVANCSNCHNTVSWTTATFNHSSTGFPLTNGHANVPCTSCHINNNYNLTIQPNDCGNSGCHLTTWQQTNNPIHSTSGPPFAVANCSNCHNTVSWTTATFDHSSTGFPLTNGHANVPCSSCHINNNYNLTIQPNDCGNSGCHLTTWQQTNNPTHSTSGPPFAAANCSSCHNTVSWTTATFDHSTTGWPLTGTHITTACTQCHINNNYNFTAANTDCYGCHTPDWISTQTLGGSVPNHVAAAFPTSLCSTCHDTVVWADGKFDHSATGWPLTGAHQLPPAAGSKVNGCADCHISNNYNLTSSNTACYGCHTAAWQSTQTLGGNVPNHISAGYPTTCDTCHTTSTWLNATFNHAYFPIPHHGSVCNDCHQVSTNYASFTCINCHTTAYHSQSMEVPRHADVPGFSYGPTTCYDCHKNGGGG